MSVMETEGKEQEGNGDRLWQFSSDGLESALSYLDSTEVIRGYAKSISAYVYATDESSVNQVG